MTTTSSHDGRKTMHQEIQHVRVNNPDLLAPIGEFTDNSESWGGASKGGIVLRETKLAVIDNGNFNEEVFHKTFTTNQDTSMTRYQDGDVTRLGKFNAGSTDSVMLLGDKGTIFHKFSGKGLMKTVIDLELVREHNMISANKEYATEQELTDFIKYQKLINEDYNIETDNGTVVLIENLRFRNTDKRYLDIKRFMTGLYDTTRTSQITWLLFNWISKPRNEKPNDIIEPQDLSFGCDSTNETLYVYVDCKNEDKYVYSTNQLPNMKLVYQAKVKTYFFETEHIKKEKAIFGDGTVESRVGFQIRRAGRIVTGINPKIWNITTGMNRGKGIRKIIDIPACKEADEDFNIGTFKKITNDSWVYFRPELQEFLDKNFRGSNAERDRVHQIEQKKLAEKYQERINQINRDDSVENLINLKTTTELELEERISNKLVIKRRNGKAYDMVMKCRHL